MNENKFKNILIQQYRLFFLWKEDLPWVLVHIYLECNRMSIKVNLILSNVHSA